MTFFNITNPTDTWSFILNPPRQTSIEMLEKYQADPSAPISWAYEPISGCMRPINKRDLILMNELATSKNLSGGEFHTADNRYHLDDDGVSSSIQSWDRKTDYLRFWGTLPFAGDDVTLVFLKTMKANVINDIDPERLSAHLNLLTIIAHATVELILAKVTAEDDRIAFNMDVAVKSQFDGSITIELGPNGWQPTNITIPCGTVIISDGYNGVITSPYVRIEQRIPICPRFDIDKAMAAASATFAKLGITDLSELNAEIEEFCESP